MLVLLLVRRLSIGNVWDIKVSLWLPVFYLSMSTCFFGMSLFAEMWWMERGSIYGICIFQVWHVRVLLYSVGEVIHIEAYRLDKGRFVASWGSCDAKLLGRTDGFNLLRRTASLAGWMQHLGNGQISLCFWTGICPAHTSFPPHQSWIKVWDMDLKEVCLGGGRRLVIHQGRALVRSKWFGDIYRLVLSSGPSIAMASKISLLVYICVI